MKQARRVAAWVESQIPRERDARRMWIASAVFAAALVLAAQFVKLDGQPHGAWLQFPGRFHVLLVHLPIGLMVLLPLLEIGGRRRPALRESAGLVLVLASATCVLSLIAGYMLALGAGQTGTTVHRHATGALGLTIAVLLCLMMRPGWTEGRAPHVYPVLLTVAEGILLFTTHQGGTLTHGAGYLTDQMPAGLRRALHLDAIGQQANGASFYATQIQPVLSSNCASCHGTGRVEAGLRLDSYGGLMRGGKSGPAIVSGNAEHSLLLTRITLPAGDKHAMPAEGRPPLSSEQVAEIRAWIAAGASAEAATVAGVTVREVQKDPAPQPVGDYAALEPRIGALNATLGPKLTQVSSNPADGLILNTADAPHAFGDDQLAAFLPFAPYIVEADLGRTAVTDKCFETLAQFHNLRALHLEQTAISGDGLQKLQSLPHLVYLNLNGTHVTKESVAGLAQLKNLRHLYLFETPAQPDVAVERSTP